MNEFNRLLEVGQSLWYDNIQRRIIENGDLKGMIQRGEIRGVTSNPTIFMNAIAKSHDYDSALQPMAWSGWNSEDIFYQLAVEDIREAADLFLPVFQESGGKDGFVSIEVNPRIAHDTEKTIVEADRLWKWVNRPNLMVKIPATKAGLPAIRKSIASGININITLIFSIERYQEVIDAFLSGLEDRLKAGLPINKVASVASFFVSRVDTKVDARLQKIVDANGMDSEKARSLLGKMAIANAQLAYKLFEESIASNRYKALQSKGAQYQRPLWASTSTKNPAYYDLVYVEGMIGKHTVDTIPPQTLDAFRDHGKVKVTLGGDVNPAKEQVSDLESLGIKMASVTQELEDEGVKSFSDSFEVLLNTIDERRKAFILQLGTLLKSVPDRVKDLDQKNAARKIGTNEPDLWTLDPAGQEEIKRRLGWLTTTTISRKNLEDWKHLLAECQVAGYRKVLLLGMGGSSLAPEVLAMTFGVREDAGSLGMELEILDSTEPGQVLAVAERSPLQSTLFVVSSKSGSTSEINAYLDFFWHKTVKRFGDRAGEHFVAITDPGTSLEKLGRDRNFRRVLQADPMVGGRFSALTAFGMVPATLLGIDVLRFLDLADRMASQCKPDVPAGRNPGLVLGSILGEAAVQGKDKLTILADPEIESVGSWLEQLVAESSGKQGKGIVPIDVEPIISKKTSSGRDRLFVYLRQSGSLDKKVNSLMKSGQPVLVLDIPTEYHLASQFYLWEYAVSVACAVLGINAFDQPDVQDAKTRTSLKITTFRQTGKLDEGSPILKLADSQVYGKSMEGIGHAKTTKEVLDLLLRQVKTGDYVAINAYVSRNGRNLALLQKIRAYVQKNTGAATTLGFGPRFLHSTGQLHKGGANNGVFLEITSEPLKDVEIPEEGLTFGTLVRAQALGDFEALQARNRRVLRLHLKNATLKELIE